MARVGKIVIFIIKKIKKSDLKKFKSDFLFKLDFLSTLIFNGATLQFQARQYKKNANANE